MTRSDAHQRVNRPIVSKQKPGFFHHHFVWIIALDPGINELFPYLPGFANSNSLEKCRSGCGGTSSFPYFAICASVIANLVCSETARIRHVDRWHCTYKTTGEAVISTCTLELKGYPYAAPIPPSVLSSMLSSPSPPSTLAATIFLISCSKVVAL